MRRGIALLAAAVLLTGCVRYDYAQPGSPDLTVYTRESAGIRLEDDFYGYCNFDFLYTGEIPAGMTDYSYGRIIGQHVDEQLDGIITSLAQADASCPADSSEQRIRALYRAYLDTDAREAAGLAPLAGGLDAIQTAQTPEEFAQACAVLCRDYGCAVLPAVRTQQDPYDSSRNTAALRQMELFYSTDELLNGKDSAEMLQMQIAEILTALGEPKAETLAYDTVTMLLAIAEQTADLDGVQVEAWYHRCKSDALAPLLADYVAAIGLDGREIVVYDPGQAACIAELLDEAHLVCWKSLAVCELVYAYREYLPPTIADALQPSSKNPEELACSAVKSLLADDLGTLYAQQYLDEQTASAVEEMTEAILAAYRRCIRGSALLTEQDRSACLAKLDGMTVNIGAPAEPRQSSTVVEGDLLTCAVQIRSAAYQEELLKLDRKPSPTDWYMTPQTFNALYRDTSNSITVPMALFHAPFFEADGDPAENLGGLGFVIAHEIGHAFDANGILYDAHGNYRPERISSERTERLGEQVTAYFGNRQIMGTIYVNGAKTKGENAADLSGMQVIASMPEDDESLRRCFARYAMIWATRMGDTEAAEMIADDSHSPAEIRVNAVLSCIDRFYEVYGITEQDGMYVPPEERVRVW